MTGFGPEYYDKVFSDPNSPYLLPDEELILSPYYPLYKMVANHSFITAGKTILDVGCGTGQFLSWTHDAFGCWGIGIDWSKKAIEVAKSRKILEFYVSDVEKDRKIIELGRYDVATFLQVLEHLEKDTWVLEGVPSGKSVILSVPNFPSQSHVRHFKDYRAAYDRYRQFVEIFDRDEVVFGPKNRAFVFFGRRR